jgi:adenosylhomocysteine nucleosidase
MRKSFNIFVLLVFVVTSLCYAKSLPEETNSPIALVFAFGPEGRYLKSLMSMEDSLFAGGKLFWKGQLQGKEIILVGSGVGMTNAAATTQLLIDKFSPKKIIFTGICGGIDSSNHIGDIVIPEKWATHDFGYYGKEGFLPDSITVFLPGKTTYSNFLFFEADSALLTIAKLTKEKIKDKLKPISARVPQVKVGGNGVSGNSFIDQVEKRKWLKENFDSQIVDMESAAVVQVALVNGVPVLVVRSCSDLAGGSGSSTAQVEIQDFFQVAADNSALFVLTLLENLK